MSSDRNASYNRRDWQPEKISQTSNQLGHSMKNRMVLPNRRGRELTREEERIHFQQIKQQKNSKKRRSSPPTRPSKTKKMSSKSSPAALPSARRVTPQSTATATSTPTPSRKKHAIADRTEYPQPQVMINGLNLLENGQGLKSCTEEERLMAKLYDEHGPVATQFKTERLEPAIRATRTFEELVDMSLQDKPMESYKFEEVKTAWKAVGLGDKKMKSPQDRVCWEIAKSGSDVIFTAPCGFGKSACFAVPAVMSGGITLVVVPLKALADSLERDLRSLNSTSFDVEQLLNIQQAKAQQRLHCSDRLHQLVNMPTIVRSLILITVLERIEYSSTLDALSQLCSTKRPPMQRLTRIVLDEFDYVDECDNNFRESYTTIFKTLRGRCKRGGLPIQIVCMSATASLHALQLSRAGSSARSKAVYLHAARILPDYHSYYCERRISDSQVSDRILRILREYKTSMKPNDFPPKCICYCLTKDICRKMANFFERSEFTSGVLHGDTIGSREGAKTIENFRNGKIDIICANKVLERGFHDNKINFIFHAVPPTSLRQYIQDTGRAGRDVGSAKCYLFFSITGMSIAENTLLNPNKKPTPHEKERRQQELNEVCLYAAEGGECRKSILSNYACLNGDLPKDLFDCDGKHLCDNCRWKTKYHCGSEVTQNGMECVTRHDISYSVRKALEGMIGIAQSNSFSVPEDEFKLNFKKLLEKERSEAAGARNKAAMNAIVQSSSPLFYDIVRMLRIDFCTTSSAPKIALDQNKAARTDWNSAKKLAKQLKRGDTKIILRNAKLPPKEVIKEKYVDCLERTHSGLQFDRPKDLHPTNPSRSNLKEALLNQAKSIGLPFLAHFELQRLLQSDESLHKIFENKDVAYAMLSESSRHGCRDESFAILQDIGKLLKSTGFMISYQSSLKKARDASLSLDSGYGKECFGKGAALRFLARLNEDGTLSLLPPEQAIGRRVFREFGSHRFLFVNVATGVSKEVRQQFFSGPIDICGRTWRFDWAKIAKDPQCYVLFAERGVGIASSEELDIEKLQRWYIDKEDNEFITLGKAMKRKKLSFSKTEPAGVLPENSVRVLPLFFDKYDIDGDGLVSKECLDFLWNEYCTSMAWGKRECPYTGFVARLGGFKGHWTLDTALAGMQLQCRASQLKYELPQRCRGRCTHQKDYFPVYDTVEICSWDKKQSGNLNSRCIQILEECGVPISTILDLARQGIEEVSARYVDGTKLLEHLKQRNMTMYEKDQEEGRDINQTDAKVLFRMLASGVAPNEPILVERQTRVVIKELESLRQKARYPIPNCCQLRMVGDHTLLLKEGEAFVALEYGLANITEVLAMRSPAYFAGDMRKLKIVNLETLQKRAAEEAGPREGLESILDRTPQQKYNFFANIKNAIVLYAVGERSDADKQSGGDYDGDMDWVCWNEALVNNFKEVPAQETANYKMEKADAEQIPFWNTSIEERLDYVYQHSGHQSWLGLISEVHDKVVDRHGFQDPLAVDLGRAAFMQVDVPYNRSKLPSDFCMEEFSKLWPHWKSHRKRGNIKTYQSKKALGTLWDLVQKEIDDKRNSSSDTKPKAEERILKYIAHEEDSFDSGKIEQVRKEMRKLIADFMINRACQWKTKNTDEQFYRWHDKEVSKEIVKFNAIKSEGMRKFAAALLYEEAVKVGSNDNAALRFVWEIATDHLCHIVPGDSFLAIANENVSALR